MKRTLSISAFCFLFSALALGQFNFTDLAFQPKPVAAAEAGWGTPTNNADGSLPFAWWVASDYYTNGSTATWMDRWTNAFPLTNGTAANFPTSITESNNVAVSFSTSGTTYLLNDNITNAQPCEVWAVLQSRQASGSVYLFTDRSDVNPRSIQINPGGSPPQLNAFAGGNLNGYYPANYIPFITVIRLAGTVGTLWTNNVQTASGNGGTSPMNGICLGARGDLLNSGGAAAFWEIIVYKGTNAPTQQSNIWYYLKTKYAL